MIGDLKAHLTESLLTTIKRAGLEGGLPQGASAPLAWEYPSDPAFGDLSTTLAFGLAKALRQKPRDVALQIAALARFPSDLVDRVEVAGAARLGHVAVELPNADLPPSNFS